MELAISQLKNRSCCYLDDFSVAKKLLKDAEEKVEEWLGALPCHLYIFYNNVIDSLWKANWRRYTTALRDSGRASLR